VYLCRYIWVGMYKYDGILLKVLRPLKHPELTYLDLEAPVV
jgi:hypothetical protein